MIETRALLAGRYVKLDKIRTHSFDVETEGASLCGRIPFESAADAMAGDTNAAPTCPTCLRRDPRFKNEAADRCFACGRPLGAKPGMADTRDGQVVFVGQECLKQIERAGDAGWQPSLGGPRLYPMQKNESDFSRRMGQSYGNFQPQTDDEGGEADAPKGKRKTGVDKDGYGWKASANEMIQLNSEGYGVAKGSIGVIRDNQQTELLVSFGEGTEMWVLAEDCMRVEETAETPEMEASMPSPQTFTSREEWAKAADARGFLVSQDGMGDAVSFVALDGFGAVVGEWLASTGTGLLASSADEYRRWTFEALLTRTMNGEEPVL